MESDVSSSAAGAFRAAGADERAPLGPWGTQLALLAAFALAIAAGLSPAAIGVRYGFPVLAAGVATFALLQRNPGLFISACLWIFTLTPLVRRVVDSSAGFAQPNVLMLAPYAAAMLSLWYLPDFFRDRIAPMRGALALLLISVLYGFMLAILNNQVLPGLFDSFRWIAPPCIAAYIIAHHAQREAIVAHVRVWALLALLLAGGYALYQYVALPAWDAFWMRNVDMDSIGYPRPYEVRVFGTLNSPAPLGLYLMVLIMMNLALRPPLRFVGILLGVGALAASLVRTAWLGLAVGLAFLFVMGRMKTKLSLLAVAGAVLLVAPVVLVDPQIYKVVEKRIDSMTNLGSDRSARERAAMYTRLAAQLDDNIFGGGLASTGTYRSYSGATAAYIVDGGPLEVFLNLGVFAGAFYFAAVIGCAASALSRSPVDQSDFDIACKASLAALLVCLLGANTFQGEVGMLAWIIIGLIFAARRGALEEPPESDVA